MSKHDGQPPNEAVDGGRLDPDGRDAARSVETRGSLKLGRVGIVTGRTRVGKKVLEDFAQVFAFDWSFIEKNVFSYT